MLVLGRIFHPFDEHEHRQVQEQENEEDDLRHKLCDDGDLIVHVAVVLQAHYDSEHHVAHAENDGNFLQAKVSVSLWSIAEEYALSSYHFESVLENDLVSRRHLPHRIHAERVRRVREVDPRVELQLFVIAYRGHVVLRPPVRAEQVDRFGEDVVVDEPRVHREDAHQEDDVATSEEDVPNFVIRFLRRQHLLLQNHPEPEECHE